MEDEIFSEISNYSRGRWYETNVLNYITWRHNKRTPKMVVANFQEKYSFSPNNNCCQSTRSQQMNKSISFYSARNWGLVRLLKLFVKLTTQSFTASFQRVASIQIEEGKPALRIKLVSADKLMTAERTIEILRLHTGYSLFYFYSVLSSIRPSWRNYY